MQQAGAVETTPRHINAAYVSWLDMLRISRTCAPNRAAALGREMTNVDVEAAVVQDAVEQDAVAVVALALAVASVAVGLDHTRGSVVMLAMLAVMIIAMTYHIHRLVLNTCMEFKIVHRLFDAMV